MKKVPLLLMSIVVCLFTSPKTVLAAPTISLISSPVTSIRTFEKYEVKFAVGTSSQYPFFQYDTNPPAGVLPGVGVTVEGIFTANGKTWRQPGFFMTETVKNGSGDSMYFTEAGNKYWVVRFSPQETGTYQVTLNATDASGTISVPVGSFTATASVKKGFIKVSQQDPRYFEFSNGELFWPIGPAWLRNNDYTRFAGTGQNFERPWLGGLGVYSTNWARWKSSGEAHGNEGFGNRLSFREKFPGSELSYDIYYGITYNNLNGHRMWLTTWMDDMFGPRLVANKKYTVKLTYKTVNIQGPRVSGQPYGFTVKTSDYAPWGDPNPDTFDSSMRSAAGTQIIVNHVATNQNWQTYTGVFTPGANRDNIYLYLDNVTSGQAYVDEFSMRECLTTDCVSLGGEVIRNPKADMHTYIEQRPAAFLDWQVEQGDANGVFFKYVVHDKNDWIQNHLNSSGQWVDSANSNGYYQDENTKARWLLRQWYRYLAARWGYSTAVHSWELNNEGPPPNPDISDITDHMLTAQAFAKFMHDTDAHPHLATTSFWCCWVPKTWSHPSLPDLDYADLHEYTGNANPTWPGYPYDMARWNYETSQIVWADRIGKPVIRAETGISALGGWEPIAALMSPNPGIWYHNLLWAQLNPGSLFDTGYWYSEHIDGVINKEAISKPFFNFVSSLDVNKGGYVDAAASVSNSKLRAWGQKNLTENKAHLWIQNSDHTWKNVMDGITSNQSGTVTVKLNPTTTYTIQRWDTYAGTVSQTQTLTSSSTGDLSLTITNLSSDVAVKIFSASGGPTPTPTPTPKPGDINGDGQVNATDLRLVISNWLSGGNCSSFNCDLNTDGKINALDAVEVIANFGK